MKWIPHFTVDILLLLNYDSDLANLSDFDSLVIVVSKSEKWAKNEGLVVHLQNLHTFEQFWSENICSKTT